MWSWGDLSTLLYIPGRCASLPLDVCVFVTTACLISTVLHTQHIIIISWWHVHSQDQYRSGVRMEHTFHGRSRDPELQRSTWTTGSRSPRRPGYPEVHTDQEIQRSRSPDGPGYPEDQTDQEIHKSSWTSRSRCSDGPRDP